MKKLFLAAIVASVALFSAWKTADKKEEKTMYVLDTKASTLGWKGGKSAEYFHIGQLSFSNGTVEMAGEQLLTGNFDIDMSSIVVLDKALPADKAKALAGHLTQPEFFSTALFPKITVLVNGYKDGMLMTTINLLGQTIQQKLPVTMVKDTKGKMTVAGKFNLDLTALKIPGLQPDPESGQGISPVIDFDLNLVLKAKK
ncbi:MAG: YceI family protein [Crocinitomicaceae bacterium]|nr:YceI family protein [Crocinitomicaceae bacterium]